MRPENEFLHDLLNPLAVVDGRLRMLRKRVDKAEGLDEKITQDVGKLEGAMKKALELIDQRRAELKKSL